MKTQFLVNASPADLIVAAEENLYALFHAIVDALPGSELFESDKICHHLAFPKNPMFKGVWQARLAPDEVDAAIDETIEWFRVRQAPFFFWWTGPNTTPANLGERLAARGLISIDEPQKTLPIMAGDLYHVNEAILEQAPEGFTIREVREESSLYEFEKVLVEGYGLPAWMGHAWVEATLQVGIGRAPWRMYLGELNGKPVATHLQFNGGGVAGVFAIATLQSERGKGIGGAITLKPLLDARTEGYRYGVLFATEMGVHVYQRIGFHLMGEGISRYLWRTE